MRRKNKRKLFDCDIGTVVKNAIYLVLSLLSLRVAAGESPEFANKVIQEHQLSGPAADRLRGLLIKTPRLTRNISGEDPALLTGPSNSWHPASRAQCRKKVLDTGLVRSNPAYEKICGAKWMAPVFQYANAPLELAQVCIDQFEFPDIPCEYPVVWVTPPVEKDICEAMGKRVCNADEWEGACAGNIDKEPYDSVDLPPMTMRAVHNDRRQVVWAFQFMPDFEEIKDTRKVCGVYSPDDPEISEPMHSNIGRYYLGDGKSVGCDAGNDAYGTCGTNTWPSGFKQDCRSSNDVYDMHGNVAESVNLPSVRCDGAQGFIFCLSAPIC